MPLKANGRCARGEKCESPQALTGKREIRQTTKEFEEHLAKILKLIIKAF